MCIRDSRLHYVSLKLPVQLCLILDCVVSFSVKSSNFSYLIEKCLIHHSLVPYVQNKKTKVENVFMLKTNENNLFCYKNPEKQR